MGSLDSSSEEKQLTFRQIEELARRCIAIHRGIAVALERALSRARDPQGETLVRQIATSERRVADSIEDALEPWSGEARDLESWVQNPPASLISEAEEIARGLSSLDVDDLEWRARSSSRKLTSFFEQLTGSVGDPRREVVDSLRQLEESLDRLYATAARDGIQG